MAGFRVAAQSGDVPRGAEAARAADHGRVGRDGDTHTGGLHRADRRRGARWGEREFLVLLFRRRRRAEQVQKRSGSMTDGFSLGKACRDTDSFYG